MHDSRASSYFDRTGELCDVCDRFHARESERAGFEDIDCACERCPATGDVGCECSEQEHADVRAWVARQEAQRAAMEAERMDVRPMAQRGAAE